MVRFDPLLEPLNFVVDDNKHDNLGPVVQSIVSLKSSLRGQLIKCFTTL